MLLHLLSRDTVGTETFDSITTQYYRGGAVSARLYIHLLFSSSDLPLGTPPGYNHCLRHHCSAVVQSPDQVDGIRRNGGSPIAVIEALTAVISTHLQTCLSAEGNEGSIFLIACNGRRKSNATGIQTGSRVAARSEQR